MLVIWTVCTLRSLKAPWQLDTEKTRWAGICLHRLRLKLLLFALWWKHLPSPWSPWWCQSMSTVSWSWSAVWVCSLQSSQFCTSSAASCRCGSSASARSPRGSSTSSQSTWRQATQGPCPFFLHRALRHLTSHPQWHTLPRAALPQLLYRFLKLTGLAYQVMIPGSEWWL